MCLVSRSIAVIDPTRLDLQLRSLLELVYQSYRAGQLSEAPVRIRVQVAISTTRPSVPHSRAPIRVLVALESDDDAD